MDDQALVRIVHRRAHTSEELQPADEIELLRLAELVDGDAIDVLHAQERHAFRSRPAVEQPSDVRVFECGQYAPLVAEPAQELFARDAADHFDRDLLIEGAIRTRGEVHAAHAAAADFAHDAVGPDHGSGDHRGLAQCLVEGGKRPTNGHGRRLVEALGSRHRRHERLDVAAQPLVTRAGRGQKRFPRLDGRLARVAGDAFDAVPFLASHDGGRSPQLPEQLYARSASRLAHGSVAPPANRG